MIKPALEDKFKEAKIEEWNGIMRQLQALDRSSFHLLVTLRDIAKRPSDRKRYIVEMNKRVSSLEKLSRLQPGNPSTAKEIEEMLESEIPESVGKPK